MRLTVASHSPPMCGVLGGMNFQAIDDFPQKLEIPLAERDRRD